MNPFHCTENRFGLLKLFFKTELNFKKHHENQGNTHNEEIHWPFNRKPWKELMRRKILPDFSIVFFVKIFKSNFTTDTQLIVFSLLLSWPLISICKLCYPQTWANHCYVSWTVRNKSCVLFSGSRIERRSLGRLAKLDK